MPTCPLAHSLNYSVLQWLSLHTSHSAQELPDVRGHCQRAQPLANRGVPQTTTGPSIPGTQTTTATTRRARPKARGGSPRPPPPGGLGRAPGAPVRAMPRAQEALFLLHPHQCQDSSALAPHLAGRLACLPACLKRARHCV